jgi:hypothetical protein
MTKLKSKISIILESVHGHDSQQKEYMLGTLWIDKRRNFHSSILDR